MISLRFNAFIGLEGAVLSFLAIHMVIQPDLFFILELVGSK